MSDVSSKANCQIDFQCFPKTFLNSVYQFLSLTWNKIQSHRKQHCHDLIQNSRLLSSLNLEHFRSYKNVAETANLLATCYISFP